MTGAPQPDKRMRLRYPGTCRLCSASLSAGTAGTEAVYEASTKTVGCLECGSSIGAASDVAGGSARREYERRKSSREKRVRARHPKLGGLILALSDDPQSTRAWERGAVGEEVLAVRLRNLPDTVRVLHDRRIRGTKANIDHIAVSPGGVWVIDAKRYKGKRPQLRVDGGILRPRVESLRVGGRDHDKLVEGVQSQVARVIEAVADATVPVHGVLCFVAADWPLTGGAFSVRGVDVVWPRLLVKRITETAPSDLDFDAVYDRLHAAFPVNR